VRYGQALVSVYFVLVSPVPRFENPESEAVVERCIVKVAPATLLQLTFRVAPSLPMVTLTVGAAGRTYLAPVADEQVPERPLAVTARIAKL